MKNHEATQKRAPTLRVLVGTLLVFLLFPFYFLYHDGLYADLYSNFAGGWYGPVSLIVGAPFAIFLACSWISNKTIFDNPLDTYVYCMIAFFFAWSVLFHFFGLGYSADTQQFLMTSANLLSWLATYMGFRYFNYGSRKTTFLMSVFWVIIIVVAIHGSEHGMYRADEQFGGSGLDDASYQGLARSALVVSALILCTKSGPALAFMGLISMILLFLVGSRTEFVGISIVVVLSMFSDRRNKALSLISIATVLLIASYFGYEYLQTGGGSRIYGLLNIGDDESWHARQMFGQFAWHTIEQHWLIGDYGSSQMEGSLGSYAHNGLSAWVDYGLFGFLQFVVLNIFCTAYSVWIYFKGGLRSPGLLRFLIAMSFYSTVCMIFSKSVGDPLFAIVWGAAGAAYSMRSVRSDEISRAQGRLSKVQRSGNQNTAVSILRAG